MNYAQKTFGSKNDWAMKKMKVIVTNPEGQLTLTPFDDIEKKMALLLTIFPETKTTNAERVFRVLTTIYAQHGECPADENFWDWWVAVRKMRVSTVHHEFTVMFQYLQLSGYYSKSFKPTLLNYRLKQRDGVKKADVVLTEDEIGYVLRKQYDTTTTINRHKQRALDSFVLALFTGARFKDIRNIVKSTDAQGNPVLLYHNHKGTRSQSVAWNPAVEGALQRGLYRWFGRPAVLGAALKAALFEALPTSSNRLITYYYLRPGQGRDLRTDGRISHITFHAARHTFCTRLLRVGISPSIVAQLAGHRSIQTTMKYYNWTREHEANDILRSAYGAETMAMSKPEWGEGAKVKPLPREIHAALLPQAQQGPLAPDDGGALEHLKKVIPKRKPSAKQLRWKDLLKREGIV
jgi:integrase